MRRFSRACPAITKKMEEKMDKPGKAAVLFAWTALAVAARLTDDHGDPAGAWAYFCRLTSSGDGRTRTKIQKIMLMK
jgi:hypothetical protein